jgi:transcriptional regulator with XRE-family HTH domain
MNKPKANDTDPIRAQMRAARNSLGWSLSTAEAKTDIPNVVIASWERGYRSPHLAQLRRWVEAFGRQLVVLEPDQIVVGADRGGEQYVTFHVVVRGGLIIDRDSRAAAEALARQIPGSSVGYIVRRRGPMEFGYWAGEM